MTFDQPDAICVGGPNDGHIYPKVGAAYIQFFGNEPGARYVGTSEMNEDGRLIFRWDGKTGD